MPNSGIVMIWRRVSDRRHAKTLVKSGGLGWTEIGSDTYSTIYDAGNVLVGLWEPDFDVMRAVNDQCSGLNFRKWEWVINPASEVLVAPRRLGPSVLASTRVLKLAAPLASAAKESFAFFDNDGNAMSFYKAPAAPGRLGTKLKSLTAAPRVARVSRAGTATRVPAPPQASQVLGFRIMVSNVARSADFYTKTLGFKSLGKLAADVTLDAGPLLALRRESHGGLIKALRAQQRLLGDWYVVQVADIDAEVARLKKLKVGFPEGVEVSGIGKMAYFNDPDGHSLALWQPSGKVGDAHPVNFYPHLSRITELR